MTINAATILKLQQLPDTIYQLILINGNPCKQIGVEELHMLAAAGHVCARWRGNRIRAVQLIVPADVAFRSLGETARLIKDALHSDANITTRRASGHVSPKVRRHDALHCSHWAGASPGSTRQAVRYDAKGMSHVGRAGRVDKDFV